MPSPDRTNQRWSMDFVTYSIIPGWRFRAPSIIDGYSQEYLAIEVYTSLGGIRVVKGLKKLSETRGVSEVITWITARSLPERYWTKTL
jgi:putative transposase